LELAEGPKSAARWVLNSIYDRLKAEVTALQPAASELPETVNPSAEQPKAEKPGKEEQEVGRGPPKDSKLDEFPDVTDCCSCSTHKAVLHFAERIPFSPPGFFSSAFQLSFFFAFSRRHPVSRLPSRSLLLAHRSVTRQSKRALNCLLDLSNKSLKYLEDWIDEDNPVRVIDVFVEELDLGELGFSGVEPEVTGRRSISSLALCKGRGAPTFQRF
jgi:hypothetical protein